MIFLLLAILSSTFIFVLFKLFPHFHVNTYQAIVLNYLTAGIAGFVINKNYKLLNGIFDYKWIYYALFIGILLLLTFLLIKYSTQNIGVSITTVACKMSVVIPVAFSIIYDHEKIYLTKVVAIILAVFSIFLLVKREKNKTITKTGWWILFLPFFLFVGLGVSDSLVKLIQNEYIKPEDSSFFTSSLFSFSFIASLLVGRFQKGFFKKIFKFQNIIGGVLLGLANFGSLLYLLKALNYSGYDSSIVFGIVNLGIILLSVLIGFFVFNEKMLKINWAGIALAVVSILMLTFFNG
ncbi:MAG: DMT family transporter [Bacteroidales bacterium]